LFVLRRYLTTLIGAASFALFIGASSLPNVVAADEQQSQQALTKAQREQQALKKEIAELAKQREKLNSQLKQSDVSIANLRKRIETIESSLKKKRPKS